MRASIYDRVTEYHRFHGDDFGSQESRSVRYDAATSLLPPVYDTLLDVGCGTGGFEKWCSPKWYNGIDLLDGTNVLDYTEPHDVVVALGILYRVGLDEQERLIRHMWALTKKALIVQTLSTWGDHDDSDVPADPLWLLGIASALTGRIVFRHDYLEHDMSIGLYR